MRNYPARPPGYIPRRSSHPRHSHSASIQDTDGFKEESRPVDFPFCEIDRGRYPRSNRKRDLERIEEGRQ